MINFKLFPYCIPVKGYKRSIICNLHDHNFIFIPNSLYDLLINLESNSLTITNNKLKKEEQDIVNQNLSYLVEKEFGFESQGINKECFPDLSLNWNTPSLITNAIIDIDNSSDFNFNNIIEQLNEIRCKFLQLRIYYYIDLKNIIKILNLFEVSSILSIDVVLPYNKNYLEKLTEVITKIKRITSIYFYESPKFEINKTNSVNIVYSTGSISSEFDCGKISPIDFQVNISNFTESLKYNSCLNRKISITKRGEIKNCPAMDKSFGNIRTDKLIDILNNKAFKKVWNINKDKIDVCKDCEFRYICTDCRAIREKKSDIYSKPLNCSYNPYTNEGF